MSAPTTASRAAAARRLRRQTPERPGRTSRDPCPHCSVDLGRAHGATRRLVVFSSQRGVFSWRCPDCHEVWSEGASSRPRTGQPGR